MKFDQDLYATCDMNSTLGSVVPLALFIIVAHNDDMSRIPTSDMIAALAGTRCGLNSFEVDKSGLSGNVRPSCYESS